MKRLILTGLLILMTTSVQALTYNTYTDRVAFDAAIQGAQTEDFEAEAVSDFTGTRVFSLFSVENTNSSVIVAGVRAGGDSTNVDGTNFLFMDFDCCDIPDAVELTPTVPTTGIGFDWRNTDPTGDVAQLVVVVDGQSFPFGASESSGFFGIVATDGEFSTVQFRDTVGNGGALTSVGIDNVTLGNAAGTARFKVTKTFSDGNDAEVDVTLTCNSGVPLQQPFTIAGGDPKGVTFIVQDIPDSGASCEVTESGGPAGYTTVMNGGDGCSWEGVQNLLYTCEITNEANPATFTVNKEWVIENGSASDLNERAYVTVYCNNEIQNGTWSGSEWYYGTWLDGNDSVEVTVDTTQQSAQCYAVEDTNQQTGIESDDDCGSRTIAAGGSSSCTFTNTVFFEGIPTLSQWGLAILAVLTLGVGLVGFRRFG